MDTLLIPATLVLVATNISFALLANHWRRQVKASEMQQAIDHDRTLRGAYQTGVGDGERGAVGRMYRAALRAERQGADVVEAIRIAGGKLEEPIFQVPAQV